MHALSKCCGIRLLHCCNFATEAIAITQAVTAVTINMSVHRTRLCHLVAYRLCKRAMTEPACSSGPAVTSSVCDDGVFWQTYADSWGDIRTA